MNIDKTLQLAFERFQAGDFASSEVLFKKVIKVQPNNIHALHNLGILCYQRGDYDCAIRHIRKVLHCIPEDANANNNMGLALDGTGKHEEAVTFYRRATQLNPAFSTAFYNLGNSLRDSGKIDEAIAAYQRALQLDPQLIYAHNNIGILFKEKGKLDDAVSHFRKALILRPDIAETHYNLGLTMLQKGQLDEAISCYRKALQLNPGYAEVYKDLGLALQVKGDRDAAITCYRKAIELNLIRSDLYTDLGLALQEKGQINEAVNCYEEAIRLDPLCSDAHIDLGNVFVDIGRLQEAHKHYLRAIEIKPHLAIAYSNVLFAMNYDPRYDAEAIFREHLKFGKKYEEPLSSVWPLHTNNCDPDRKLRIGYVSPDFRRHSVAYFIEPILFSHNRERHEIFCYADVLRPDDITRRIEGYSDKWKNINGLADDVVSEMIQDDRIDILVDLAGHTARKRMLLFARKPAPVQVSWIGYPATTGLSAMDYKIVDGHTDPPGMTERFYTENLVRMPGSFLCYLPNGDSPDTGPLPSLTEGRITFGSFHKFSKASVEILGKWARILAELPRSRLMLKSQVFTVETARGRVTDIFEKENISPDRIEFMSFEPSVKDHLNLYNRIDIALDTFPYHGTTTTCEALWMGVPVITLAGNSHVSRVGVSLLSNVGLSELIASTAEEYITKAVNLAKDQDKLKTLRQQLRQMMRNSPLTDQERFTAQLEQTYRQIWKKWCEVI
jgi:protein O-GlcNAc transferase